MAKSNEAPRPLHWIARWESFANVICFGSGGVALLAFFAFFIVLPVKYFLDWGDESILNALGIALAVGLAVNLTTMPVAVAISSYVDGERTLDRIDAGSPYFMYLRSFAIEGDLVNYGRMPFPAMFFRGLSTRAIFGLGTQIKAAVAERDCELVCIGGSDETPGVTRYEPEDAVWQAFFLELAGEARGIVMIPFATTSTLWEFEWILANAYSKTMFILPPADTERFYGKAKLGFEYDRGWQEIRGKYADRVQLPKYDASGLVFTLTKRDGILALDHAEVFSDDAVEDALDSIRPNPGS